MGNMHFFRVSIILMAAAMLCGCGVSVPRIGEAWDRDDPGNPNAKDPIIPVTASGQIEYEIKKRIYCSLREAVKEADRYRNKTVANNKLYNEKLLPDNWGAQAAISLQVDENIALNPGLALNTPLPNAISSFPGEAPVTTAQSRSFALGGNLSSTASRTDKFNSYWTIGYLRRNDPNVLKEFCTNPEADYLEGGPNKILPARSSFLADDLGITQWLLDAMFIEDAIPSYGTPDLTTDPNRDDGGKEKKRKKLKDEKITAGQDTISIEIKFVIVSSGNFTPSWKLVRVAANTGSNAFFSAGRTRTHDLILTIGPRSNQTDYANLALQIGQAVSGSNRSSGLGQ